MADDQRGEGEGRVGTQGMRSLIFQALPQWRVIAADPPNFAEVVPAISPIIIPVSWRLW